jgi:glycosyltransferase involved in cell wall biosynthesis
MRVIMDGWLFTWVRGSGVRWAMQCLHGWPPADGDDSVILLVPYEAVPYVPKALGPGVTCVVGDAQLADSHVERRIEWDQSIVPALCERLGGDVYYNASMTAPLGVSVPTCIVVHDLYFLDNDWGRTGDFYRQWVIPSVRQAARVCAPSPLVSRQLVARLGLEADRVRITAPDLGPAFYEKHAGAVAKDLASFDLAPGYVLFVGDLVPRKRVPFLLEAMASHYLSDRHLVIVGGGRDPAEEISTRVAALPKGFVHFVPWVSDDVLCSLYCGAAVTALPAKWEGFCFPAFESAVCGTPVVVAEGTPAAESGFPGIRGAPADDPEVFAMALHAAMRFRVFGARQTWSPLADSTWRVLRECVG